MIRDHLGTTGTPEPLGRAGRRRYRRANRNGVDLNRNWPTHFRPFHLPGAFAHGLEIDHLHAGNGALAMLVECSMGGLRLASSATWFSPFCWYNPARPRTETERVLPGLEPFLRS